MFIVVFLHNSTQNAANFSIYLENIKRLNVVRAKKQCNCFVRTSRPNLVLHIA